MGLQILPTFSMSYLKKNPAENYMDPDPANFLLKNNPAEIFVSPDPANLLHQVPQKESS